MGTSIPETVICHYQVKPGHEAEMEKLLAKHWPTLHEAGLVTDDPPLVYRGKPDSRHDAGALYIEIFAWRSDEAPNKAHQLPEVKAMWDPMGAICERMDFPHFDRIEPEG